MPAPDPAAGPRIAILLCTYNGERYLREQLDSYYAQTHGNWELWISDDGSTDRTLEIVGEYARREKAITIVEGPRRGATANFLALTRRDDIRADYFAWSDADDVWLPDKLARASAWLDSVAPKTPALYCGRTMVVDSDNRFRHLSPLFARPPGFRNALCQNIGGGNTMVFNAAARALLREGDQPEVVTHDWWAYMLVSGCGGLVRYDCEPCLRYRQHAGNLIGANMSPAARWSRIRQLFGGVMRERDRLNTAALADRRHLLDDDARDVLDLFVRAMRADGRWQRLRLLRRAGVHRQNALHNLALYLAALVDKYP